VARSLRATPEVRCAQGDRRDRPPRVQHRRRRILAGERASTGATCRRAQDHRADGVLPRTHGSALFTRGETQHWSRRLSAPGATRRSSTRSRRTQRAVHDALQLPPFSWRDRNDGLAKRAKSARQPCPPRRQRGDADMTTSRTSSASSRRSSSRTVRARWLRCAARARADGRGVPLKAPVAGVAMASCSRVASSRCSPTSSATRPLATWTSRLPDPPRALRPCRWTSRSRHHARDHAGRARTGHKARLHILGEMAKVITSARPTMSEWAPTIIMMKIDPEKIREVIGKGGAVIRASPRKPAPRSTSRMTARQDRVRQRRCGREARSGSS